MKKCFQTILHQLKTTCQKSDDHHSKTNFMKLVGNIISFLATRKAVQCLVPTLSSNPAEQIRSIMLNIEQLRILHSNVKKKFVIGNFGSGKTLLGLCQLQYLAEQAEQTIRIFYICWNCRSMLVHDVQHFIESHLVKYATSVRAINIADLSKELHLQSIPSISQLLLKLLQTYQDQILHLIIDEYDGEMLSLESAKDLKSAIARRELMESNITIFPHSLRKNRTFVSSKEVKHHRNYQYDETGFQVFSLTKCMRTTKENFGLIRGIEELICNETVTIKHPKDKKHTSKNVKKSRVKTKDVVLSLRRPDSATSAVIKTDPIHQQQSSTNALEIPRNLEDIAEINVKNPVHKSKKTVTKFEYPRTDGVGHNVAGTKPVYYRFPNQHLLDNYEVITKLAVIFEEHFYDDGVNKLVICNTPFHYYIMENVLHALQAKYFICIEYDDWKLKDNKGCPSSTLPYNGCVLTNYEGSRGKEADKVFLCVDPEACQSKRVFLESITRSNFELHLIELNNVKSSSIIKSSVAKRITLRKSKSSPVKLSQIAIGHTLNELILNGLVISRDILDASANEATSLSMENHVIKIDTSTEKYMQIYSELVKNGQIYDGSCHVPNFAETFRMLQQPKALSQLICHYQDETSCLLKWETDGFDYIIRRKEVDSGGDWEEVSRTSKESITIREMEVDTKYRFSVAALSTVEASESIEITYIHTLPPYDGSFKEIKELISKGQVLKLGKLLQSHPDIVDMRDHMGWTPLMHAVWYNKTSMVEVLLAYGSDVSVKNAVHKRNCHHFSAMRGNIEVLKLLLWHDATHINCRDVDQQTPLHCAVEARHVACVEQLLLYNIDITIKDKNGETAYDRVTESNRVLKRMFRDYLANKEKRFLSDGFPVTGIFSDQ